MTVKVINRPAVAREVYFSVTKTRNIIYAVLVAVVAASGLWLLLGTDETAQGVGFLTAAVLLIPLYAWRVHGFIKQFAYAVSQACALTPEQYIIFEERIISERHVNGEIMGKTVVEYASVRKAWETKNLILIHSRDNRILVLTKCDLTDTEQADVKRLLQTVGVPCRFKKA